MSPVQEKLWKAGFGIPQNAMEAPDFNGTDLAGNAISLKDLKGKVVLLNLWATWCPPCRAEMPSLEKLHQSLKDSNFTILAVGTPTPPRETREKIISFVSDNGYTFPVMIDESQAIASQYGSGSIPTSWIIGADGKVVARYVGGMDWNSDLMLEVFKELIP
ncbi:MAG: TlpA family protein disulfide reductase [Spirochaetaceae bacterium]|nr:TlpA family protein disulfide reductase [Spirochaetaceae bacterium]